LAYAAFQTVLKLQPDFEGATQRLNTCFANMKREETEEALKLNEQRNSIQLMLKNKTTTSNKSQNGNDNNNNNNSGDKQ